MPFALREGIGILFIGIGITNKEINGKMGMSLRLKQITFGEYAWLEQMFKLANGIRTTKGPFAADSPNHEFFIYFSRRRQSAVTDFGDQIVKVKQQYASSSLWKCGKRTP